MNTEKFRRFEPTANNDLRFLHSGLISECFSQFLIPVHSFQTILFRWTLSRSCCLLFEVHLYYSLKGRVALFFVHIYFLSIVYFWGGGSSIFWGGGLQGMFEEVSWGYNTPDYKIFLVNNKHRNSYKNLVCVWVASLINLLTKTHWP